MLLLLRLIYTLTIILISKTVEVGENIQKGRTKSEKSKEHFGDYQNGYNDNNNGDDNYNDTTTMMLTPTPLTTVVMIFVVM